MKVILLSGTHGVGKGFFLDKVKASIQHYNVYTASALIERYQPSTDAGYKKVSNVNNNQDILIKAIKEEKLVSTNDIIIDGHLCVLNAKGEVERIPEYFFVDAQITGIVLLQDEPRIICDRLNQRDSNKISIKDIELMQNEEQKYAMELQNKNQIKCVKISHKCTGKQFEENLRNLGGDFVE